MALRPACILLALPLLVAGLGGGGAPAGAAGGLADPRPCVAAPGFTCSTLTVPVDHSGGTPGTLRLQVAVQDVAASRGTFLFLTGGPGQPGAPFAARVALKLAPALAGYRVVAFDQRGTGVPALRCPALQRRMGSSDLAVPTRSEVVDCARAVGAKRRFFGTDQTVQDIDVRRRALRAPLPAAGRSPRARLGGAASGDRRPLRRERARGRPGPARGLPRATLPRRSGEGPRRRRPPLERLDGPARRAGDDERGRSHLPRRPGGAARGATGSAGPAREPDLRVQARPADARGGAQPGPPCERAVRRQPDALGGRRDARRAAAPGAPPRRRPHPPGGALAVHASRGLRERDRPDLPLLAAGACDPGGAPRAVAASTDAAPRGRPRPLDAARVGAAGGVARSAREARRRPRRGPLRADAGGQRRGPRRAAGLPPGPASVHRERPAARRLRHRGAAPEGDRVPGDRRRRAPRRAARLGA